MMGSITGHTGTGIQHRPVAPNGCMWLWDAELWLLQESDLGGLLCGKSVRPHYCCLYDQRPSPCWRSSCITEFQRGKWTSWWSTSGLKRTMAALLASAAGRRQTATSRWGPQMFSYHVSAVAALYSIFHIPYIPFTVHYQVKYLTNSVLCWIIASPM